ncbi:hypothetical protein KJ765_05545 [Candidatus Micrarchaeota archaeon]|nr:hypothetical protein [Candidatus Micrarchaeota archaeon]
MKHSTSLKLARHGAKLFLSMTVAAAYLYLFDSMDFFKWIAAAFLISLAFLIHPNVERLFEETFEIIEP